MRVVLATMSMESHGGVADQMTNLALMLAKEGVAANILIRNPLSESHNYIALLRKEGICVWSVSSYQYQWARKWCHVSLVLLMPLVILDALFRRKTVLASRQTAWGVLRRVGYWGLDGLFLIRLAQARFWLKAEVFHFRKPDGWRMFPWAKRLGLLTMYTEDTVPTAATRHYYEGIARVQSYIDLFTAVSQASARELSAFLQPSRVVDIISYMVQLPKEKDIYKSDGFFKVASIARLAPQKDVATLITAVFLLIKQCPQIRLTIYGDGPLRSELEAQVDELGVQAYVHFAGAFAKKELPTVMANTDVVVLSTHYEGFGIVLLEGMAYGKPVIGTAVSGVTEVIDDNVTGFLVPPQSPDLMAQKIEQLMTNPELYKRMSDEGKKKYLNNFTPKIVTQQYRNVYQSLCDATKKL